MNRNAVKLIVLFCRIILATTFIFSGFVKAIDPVGSAIKFGDYFTALNITFFQDHTLILSVFLSALEFTIGAALLWGAYKRLASLGAFLFMLLFTPLTLWLALTNAVSDCGCFGDAVTLDNWETFYKNVVLFILSLTLLIFNKKIGSWFNIKIRWIPAAYSFIFAIVVSLIGIKHLPAIDFRPYRIGTEIKEAMGMNSSGEKEYELIYEKEGEKKSFSLDGELPEDGSGWEFVETVVKETNAPQITIKDFFITDNNGNNITEDFLENDTVAFVLLSYDLFSADENNLDKINELYEIVSEMKLPFYVLTSYNPEAQDYWDELSGSEFNYVFGDITVIETIIRSNPGLMVLHKDKIIDKINVADLPEPELMESYVEDRLNLNIKKVNTKIVILLFFFAYFIPILVLLLTDKTFLLFFKGNKKDKNDKINND